MAVSLTNFLDSGCIVASSLALTAWAAAFNFGSAWTAILGAIGANAFGAAVGALIGGFLTDKFGRTTIYKYNLLVYAAGVFIAMVAVNLPMVVVGVVLSGLSVGAGVPASWSYISETSTSTKRCFQHRHQPVRMELRSRHHLHPFAGHELHHPWLRV